MEAHPLTEDRDAPSAANGEVNGSHGRIRTLISAAITQARTIMQSLRNRNQSSSHQHQKQSESSPESSFQNSNHSITYSEISPSASVEEADSPSLSPSLSDAYHENEETNELTLAIDSEDTPVYSDFESIESTNYGTSLPHPPLPISPPPPPYPTPIPPIPIPPPSPVPPPLPPTGTVTGGKRIHHPFPSSTETTRIPNEIEVIPARSNNNDKQVVDGEKPSCSWAEPVKKPARIIDWPDSRISVFNEEEDMDSSNQLGGGDDFVINPPIDRDEELELEEAEMTGDNFDLVRSRVRYFLKGTGISITFVLNLMSARQDGPLLMDLSAELYAIFHQILQRLRTQCRGDALFRVVIEQAELENPIIVPLVDLRRITPQAILDRISEVSQSKRELKADESLFIRVEIIQPLQGGVNNYGEVNVVNGPNNDRERKRSIVTITNHDNLCMMRAILVAWASCRKISTEEWDTLTNSLPGTRIDKALSIKKVSETLYKDLTKTNRKEQRQIVDKVVTACAFEQNYIPKVDDLEVIENYLETGIYIISSTCYNKIMRTPSNENPFQHQSKTFIYHSKTLEGNYHFDAITNITGFYGKGYFCTACFKSAKSREQHKCSIICQICDSKECTNNVDDEIDPCDDEFIQTDNGKLQCFNCNRECRSILCYNKHKTEN